MIRAFGHIVVFTILAADAFAAVQFSEDAQHQTSRVSGMTEREEGCAYQTFSGIVAQRSFASDGLTLSGFIIESADGTRTFINVSMPQTTDRLTHSVVLNGFQRLLRVGRRASGRVQACGSGPVLTLDQVQ